MGKALFYHLTRDPLEVTVANLCTRALQAGWRVAIRGRSIDQLDRLDQALWLGDKASFLPHGLAGGAHDADQPILLTRAPDSPNSPNAVMSVDQASISPSEVAALERLWVLFDGADDTAVALARTQWKAMVSAGVTAEYWSQDSGKWQMKAQSGQ
jgi:DNA polymerase III subunit chi